MLYNDQIFSKDMYSSRLTFAFYLTALLGNYDEQTDRPTKRQADRLTQEKIGIQS